MKITTLLILITFMQVSAIGYSQSSKISMDFKNKSLEEIFTYIEQSTDYSILYKNELIENAKLKSGNYSDWDVVDILSDVLKGEHLNYSIKGKIILIVPDGTIPEKTQQQENKINGKVLDESGTPLPGVTIVVKGTTVGTITGMDGTYSLEAPVDGTLEFSFIGMSPQIIEIKGQTTINVVMKEETIGVDEVVVIGYGTVAKKDVTTAVSTVSTKDLEERPIISAAQAIQGKAAGVNVYQPNGAPGGEMVIRVRGTTSFNGSNEPLYVVDGVPVDNMNFLSPTDIASMQILKDASSAAIYGSRAANGVILITTKQASGGAKVAANVQVGISEVANQIHSLNATQYKELIDEIRPGAIPEGTTDKTDWFNEVYGTGITQNYQLQVSDGNDKTRYFVSGGYLNEKGVLSSAFFRRYNFRSNIESQVRKWLRFGVNLSYSDNSTNGVTTGAGSNRGGVVLAVVNLPTASSVINEETGLYNRVFFGQNITNPVESIKNGRNNKNTENRLIASGSSTITFLPELDLKTSFTLDRRNGKNTGFTPPVHGTDRDDWGSAWDTRSMNTLLVFDNVLTYKKTFAEKHNFEAMTGTSWTDSQWSQSYINGSHFRDAFIQTLNAANKIAWDNTGSNASDWGIMSFFGRASYNFESKYLFTFNIREDGSSKLHPDHRWGTFPSFSGAWRLSSENFMKSLSWLSDLKIRGGWGQTGNQSGVGGLCLPATLQYCSPGLVRKRHGRCTGAVPAGKPADKRSDLGNNQTGEHRCGCHPV